MSPLVLLALFACDGPADPQGPKDGGADDSGDPVVEFDCGPDQDALRSGVDALDLGGALPSPYVVHGEQACPVLIDSQERTWLASARLGEGRVAAIGHEGWLANPPAEGDAARLLVNLLTWSAGLPAPRVAVAPGLSGPVDWLPGQGMQGESVDTAALTQAEELSAYQVLVVDAYTAHGPEALAAIAAFVEAGGGLLVGGHGWYYGPSYADPAVDYPANQLLNPAGITLTTATADSGEQLLADRVPTRLHHHTKALTALYDHATGEVLLSPDEVLIGADTAIFAASQLPLSFQGWWGPAKVFLDGLPPVVPTVDDPVVPAEEPVEALAVALASRWALEAAPTEVYALDAAADFPGMTGREGSLHSVELTPAWAGRDPDLWYSSPQADLWLSTGTWADAGAIVDFEVPPQWVGQGLQLQIGSHSDTLWDQEEWTRSPELLRRDPLLASTGQIASGFGGLVYLVVPAGTDLGPGVLTLDNVVDAGHSAWTELEADGIVLTVPSDPALWDEDDTAAISARWSELLAAAWTLYGAQGPRDRVERIVLDRQISAGWMHSGYPIMGHLETSSEMMDLSVMDSAGAWGPFHELGHNHQLAPAQLPGVTEATCNLWSVYMSEEVLGIDRALAHPSLTPSARAATISAYLAGGKDFAADWNVWTALETYLQLQEAFGWGPILAVHQQYALMSPAERPDSDQERIDQWAIRTSLASEADLSGFYEAWGWPLGPSVKPAVGHLPPWSDHPMAN